jgi:hypothetical protein
MRNTSQLSPLFGISPYFVILNLFQDNKQPSRVILKQVQDDDDFFEFIGPQ